tara:strand:- start:150 stop:800 length:651 start_codon:yes stop_codon:yes gene_type:complete
MITNIIRKDFVPPRLENSAINILATMEELKVSEIPIVNSDYQFLGLIEEKTILNMENLQEPLQFMQNQLKNIFIFSETNLFQTIRVFREYQLSLLPVIDVDKTYLGYIQPADIIAEIGSVNYDATTTMTIIVEKKDYNLHEISRLIQENNGAILSFFSQIKQDKLHLTILINCNNSQSIIRALKRYDYQIIEQFSEQLKTGDLDDRFESFIKYLNI